MIRLRPSGADGVLIKRIIDWYDPGPGVFISNPISAFSPLSLFAAGEQGVWYDPSDLTTLFQDSAGTTPVTAVEQPVGLMLDKRLGLVLGSELVTNGTFDTDTGWTKGTGWTISGGSANANIATGSNLDQSATTTSGKFYAVTFTVSNYVSGSVRIRFTGTANISGTIRSANGTYTEYLNATTTNTTLRVTDGGAGFVGSVDNISVKELPGNHAYQSTSAARPVLSARYNLLTKTEQFDQSPWTVNNASVTANSTTDPIGGNTGTLLKEDSATAWHRLNSSTFTVTGSHTLSIAAKAATRSWIAFCYYADGVAQFTYFNLSTGAVGTNASGSTATITSLGNGWYRCSVTRTLTGGVSQLIAAPTTGDGVSSYAGNGTSGIYVWGADLRVSNDGVGIPAYQRVNTSTDYDTTGFPLYIRPNGGSQFMVTNSINFSATDKMTVWGGYRRIANGGVPLELSVAVGSNAGSFYVFAGDRASAAGAKWTISSRGSAADAANQAVETAANYNAPLSNVVTGIFSISGNSTTLRINGAQVGQATGSQGTGNFGTYPLYLFARAGTNLWFNGRFYGLIVRGAASTAQQISDGETYMNNLTKAY